MKNMLPLDKFSFSNLDKESKYVHDLKEHFIAKLKSSIIGVKFNGFSGDIKKSTYTLINVQFPLEKSKAELFLFKLDLKGIACSKGSACQSGSDLGSHVLKEVLTKNDLNNVSIRFSLSIYNTKEQIDIVVDEINNLLG